MKRYRLTFRKPLANPPPDSYEPDVVYLVDKRLVIDIDQDNGLEWLASRTLIENWGQRKMTQGFSGYFLHFENKVRIPTGLSIELLNTALDFDDDWFKLLNADPLELTKQVRTALNLKMVSDNSPQPLINVNPTLVK